VIYLTKDDEGRMAGAAIRPSSWVFRRLSYWSEFAISTPRIASPVPERA